MAYDELQFRVTQAGGELVVDPATAGRYQGPFQPGDQDVLVYLRDDLDGSRLHCEASAFSAGAVIGSGAGDVTVVRGEIEDVDLLMAAPGGAPSKPSDAPPDKPAGEGDGKCDGPGKMKCGKDETCVAGVCTEVQSQQP